MPALQAFIMDDKYPTKNATITRIREENREAWKPKYIDVSMPSPYHYDPEDTLGFLGIKLEDLLLEDANTLKTAQITYHAEPSRPCYELPSPHTPQWTWCATTPREPCSRSEAC